MFGFFQSFLPLFQKYRSEVILLAISLIIAIFSCFIFFQNTQTNQDDEIILNQESTTKLPIQIMVDIAGAVNKPGVYQATAGARLKDIINLAQGLNNDADISFFNRNFNLARYISDQEKIYVPSILEINIGIFLENGRTLDYTSPVSSTVAPTAIETETDQSLQQSKININFATLDELDKLPGIGQVTAKKIIDNRPYQSIVELSTKKIVNKSVWEKIKSLVIN